MVPSAAKIARHMKETPMNVSATVRPLVLLSTAAALLAGCAGMPWARPKVDAEAACAALMAPIPAAAISLPSGGAVIESATLLPASSLTLANPLPFIPPPPEAVVVPATPQYCKVLGAIQPVDPAAPPIRFQVNLPTPWNGRSLQLGGGGFNGVLVNPGALPPSGRIDQPSPLARGFVTVGTDSGHQNSPSVPLQAFALNDEALVNFAHASYKKVRDVSVELMKRRYGQPPLRSYFMGSSEGGREGLTMAQRYPQDFDGIFARVPVINWMGLQAAGTRMGTTQMGEGWLSPAHVKLVHDAVLGKCDALDWLSDGVVGNPQACHANFDPASLRCIAPVTTGCLNEAQVEALRTLHSPYEFSFALANGVRSYPGWAWGGEGASGTGPVGGYVSWQTGSAPQTYPAGAGTSRAWLYGSGALQYFVARNVDFDPRTFKPEDRAQRVLEISQLMDSTDPDLSAFKARGGKLVMSEHLADYAQSPYAGIEYYRSVVAKMGQPAADDFLRLYTTPGADHVGTGAPVGIDMLQVLVDWVEHGRAPLDLVQVSLEAVPPYPVTASRPMCRWPAVLRYRGHGDKERASSFECARSATQ
ncbi:MAG: tannase/feruloyl esterase family alpha/beta hydrolase [Ramlibacter sp.]|nr:tannase/feruloyl esterase family alpha/beta hydrolase [Ramlibacter sp.]